MKNQLKNGISLITLVITIIVVIILAGVVILSLQKNNPIENATKAKFISDISAFKEQLELYKQNEILKNNGEFDGNSIQADSISLTQSVPDPKYSTIYDVITGLKNSSYGKDEFVVIDGQLVYKGKDKKYQDWAKDAGIDVEKGQATTGNVPILASGMTPIKWINGTGDPVSTTSSDSAWYNYTNKQWANAMTKDGSMWVWIPRYEYKITTLNHQSSTTGGNIDVKFIPVSETTADEGYIIEPAFIFGTTQLSGIWVAKFEASGSTSSIEVKPGVNSLTVITISDIFTACINMKTNTSKYGWNSSEVDTHLMKNVEWGACAYLAQSIYGKNSEVWINPNSNYITGQAGTSVSASSTTSTYTYNDTTYGVNASTTGNVYGIYDMSGGAWEFVAAYVNNGNRYLTTCGSSLVNADAKYKDVYTSNGDTEAGNYSAASSKVGDAVYETSSLGNEGTYSWYSDYSSMPYSDVPFFVRGAYYNYGTYAGLFYFGYYSGGADISFGFRPVVSCGG